MPLLCPLSLDQHDWARSTAFLFLVGSFSHLILNFTCALIASCVSRKCPTLLSSGLTWPTALMSALQLSPQSQNRPPNNHWYPLIALSTCHHLPSSKWQQEAVPCLDHKQPLISFLLTSLPICRQFLSALTSQYIWLPPILSPRLQRKWPPSYSLHFQAIHAILPPATCTRAVPVRPAYFSEGRGFPGGWLGTMAAWLPPTRTFMSGPAEDGGASTHWPGGWLSKFYCVMFEQQRVERRVEWNPFIHPSSLIIINILPILFHLQSSFLETNCTFLPHKISPRASRTRTSFTDDLVYCRH